LNSIDLKLDGSIVKKICFKLENICFNLIENKNFIFKVGLYC